MEAVQKFAGKVCCKNWNMDYESIYAGSSEYSIIATKEVTIKG